MISVDNRKVEALYQFVSFLEAVSNADALKETVEQLKVESDKLRELIEARTKLEALDQYVRDAEAQLEAAALKLTLREEEFAAKQKKWDEARAVAKASLEERLTRAEESTMQANQLAESAKQKNAEAEKLLKEYLDRIEAARAKEESLAEREAALAAKAEKIKALVGE